MRGVPCDSPIAHEEHLWRLVSHSRHRLDRVGHGPLPDDVECYALAATLGKRRGLVADRLIGDGLVPLDSALGRHPDAGRTLAIPKSRQWIGYEMGHLDLLGRPEVYSQLEQWLR